MEWTCVEEQGRCCCIVTLGKGTQISLRRVSTWSEICKFPHSSWMEPSPWTPSSRHCTWCAPGQEGGPTSSPVSCRCNSRQFACKDFFSELTWPTVLLWSIPAYIFWHEDIYTACVAKTPSLLLWASCPLSKMWLTNQSLNWFPEWVQTSFIASEIAINHFVALQLHLSVVGWDAYVVESLQGRAVQTSISWHLEWNPTFLTWTSEDGRWDLNTICLITGIWDASSETSRSAYFF